LAPSAEYDLHTTMQPVLKLLVIITTGIVGTSETELVKSVAKKDLTCWPGLL